ncbi:MAG: histidine--tRNA ligase [Candidatus Oxydemutatoraceae bacterium WSBS_2016_MAG_OTU14]
MSKIQSVRGIHDILPQQVAVHRHVQYHAEALFHAFGYEEIRLPILEKTALFKRSIGDVTDIVDKEMYTFTDSGDTLLSLRPEGTASCVRACIQHGLIGKGQQQRLWYGGPFFRRERPQKARYRQFNQIGVEIFGFPSATADIELLLMFDELMQRLLVQSDYTLEINTLGNPLARSSYCQALSDYFNRFSNNMNEEIRRRIDKNPLRVMDSKDPNLADMIANAPVITDYLDKESLSHFETIQEGLDSTQVKYRHNPRMVRGLDYYSGHVFEFVANVDGQSSSTICAGGRYDGLSEQLGGSAVPAVGFAFGLDRFVHLYEGQLQVPERTLDVYAVCVGQNARQHMTVLTRGLHKAFFALAQQESSKRQVLPQIMLHLGDDKLTTQLKRANKLNAKIALIIGDEEVKASSVTIKFMQSDHEQQSFSSDNLALLAQQLLQWL